MNTLPISYTDTLVAISVLLSITSAHSAFTLADRMRAAASRLQRLLWLAGGSIAMGTGIWSMHYLGMLAVNLSIPVRYDAFTVLGSLLLAMVASAVALLVVSADRAGWKNILTGGLLMGAGIGGMHYLGMAAMRCTAMQMYSAPLVALSIVIAIVLATLALRIACLVPLAGEREERLRIAAGVLMGIGIAAMHYVAMTAVHFMPGKRPPASAHTVHISTLGEIAVTLAAVTILLVAHLSAAIEKKRYRDLDHAHALLAQSNSELEELSAALSILSIRDGLTNLYNRRHFDSSLDIEWSRATRSGQSLALLIVDIDHFKQLNDRFGHSYGDRCLQAIARAMENRPFRREDVIARIGGEEFALILPGADLVSAIRVAETIRLGIPNVPSEDGLVPVPPITVSIGVCCCVPQRDSSPEQLFRESDAALYLAKAQGRNRVCIAGQDHHPHPASHPAHPSYCGSCPLPCAAECTQAQPEQAALNPTTA